MDASKYTLTQYFLLQYRVYPVKDGEGGKMLPFLLCDSMGLDERKEAGLCIDDIPHILNGYVPDRYQVRFLSPQDFIASLRYKII